MVVVLSDMIFFSEQSLDLLVYAVMLRAELLHALQLCLCSAFLLCVVVLCCALRFSAM